MERSSGVEIPISGCSAVGSVPDLGSGGREFESPHSDHLWVWQSGNAADLKPDVRQRCLRRFDTFHPRHIKDRGKKMKLREACEIAESAGLRTIGEAVLNIEMNAGMFWSYEEMVGELNELVREADQYGDETSIFYMLEGKE